MGIFEETRSIFEKVSPHNPLIDSEDDDVGWPEENIEERHVHIVVVTIIDKSTISVF